MRGSHPQDVELKSRTRAATLGKVALATNPCEEAMRSLKKFKKCRARLSFRRRGRRRYIYL